MKEPGAPALPAFQALPLGFWVFFFSPILIFAGSVLLLMHNELGIIGLFTIRWSGIFTAISLCICATIVGWKRGAVAGMYLFLGTLGLYAFIAFVGTVAIFCQGRLS